MSQSTLEELSMLQYRVVQKFGAPIQCMQDCSRFSAVLHKEVGKALSASTIYRFFMQSDHYHLHYKSTLNVLSRFIGYDSFDDFRMAVEQARFEFLIASNKQDGDFRSLISVLVKNRCFDLIKEYLDGIPYDSPDEFMAELGWSIYMALRQNPEVELEFYQSFCSNMIVRKGFYEYGADPEFNLPRYEDALACYLSATPTVPEQYRLRDFIFGHTMLLRHDFMHGRWSQFSHRWNQFMKSEVIEAAFEQVTPAFPLSRLCGTMIMHAHIEDNKNMLDETIAWIFQYGQLAIRQFSFVERRALLHCVLEALISIGANEDLMLRFIDLFPGTYHADCLKNPKSGIIDILVSTNFNGLSFKTRSVSALQMRKSVRPQRESAN
jgi:hypothetical protein